jgi:farnesol dehydrogenase
MRVLVTGGTGYLGGAIVRALAARGHEPVVFARRASTADLPGKAVDGDVRDRSALVAASRGCDAMCHTAALVSLWRADPSDFDRVNVGGLEHALDAVREAGLRRLVYTSSFLARPPAGRSTPLISNDYQRTKAAADAVARKAQAGGAPMVRLYPGVVYGPGARTEGNLLARLFADHLAKRLPGLVGAEHIWSYAWVRDVADAHVSALEHPAPAAEYGLGGVNTSQLRPFEILKTLTGRGLPRRVPYWAAGLVARLDVARARLTGRMPQLTPETVEIFRHDWPVESAEAVRDLRFKVTPLDEGVAAVVADLRTTTHRST